MKDPHAFRSVKGVDEYQTAEEQDLSSANVKYGINDMSLELLELPAKEVEDAKRAWSDFMEQMGTPAAAGEAIYTALFKASPAIAAMFTTSKAVQAMRFVGGINILVDALGNDGKLKRQVEMLGFQHLHLEIFPQRVVVFRDALLELFEDTLGNQLTHEARTGLIAMLNYTGGGLIYVKTHYAKRLDTLIESWTMVRGKEAGGAPKPELKKSNTNDSSGVSTDADSDPNGVNGKAGNGESRGQSFVDSPTKSAADPTSPQSSASMEVGAEGKKKDAKDKSATNKALPTSFSEMFSINAAVMGVTRKTMAWMEIVIESWDNFVMNVKNSERIKEESCVLALRLSKFPEGTVDLKQFKACMLAALRSSLPKIWSTMHEEAWTWFWENVSGMVQVCKDDAVPYEESLASFFGGQDEEAMAEMRMMIYERFFELCPEGQNFFKQSNTRLNFIASRILAMTQEIIQEPKRMVSDLSALGLRHVGFGIPIDLIAPFVTSCVEVLGKLCDDSTTVEAFRWSLGLIAKILIRTIQEGSTVVMKAINANSPKMLRKAISVSPRRDRARWALDVQVGDQHISPLAWSIESGSFKVADALLRDLLTIRGDRARYYYGVDALFEKHPGIVKLLCEDAPELLRTLLDGLIWRSHRTENAGPDPQRRVHYFLKHMLVKPNGNFSEALKWISSTGDPSIVSHPMVKRMGDTLWSGLVLRQFISSRMWNMFSLLVFILSQEVLPSYVVDGGSDQTMQLLRTAIFVGRLFNYVFGMGRLGLFHLYRIWVWARNTMRTIIEEIDTDGNGEIDYDEMMEALATFKDTVKGEIKKAIKVLKDDDGARDMEDARKAMASQEKNMYNMISMVLMLLLFTMSILDPYFRCAGAENWPTDECAEAAGLTKVYSVLSMFAMIVHWMILMDLAVFSTEISAFLLVCTEVLSEVKTFLMALAFLLLLFGSAISIQCIDCPSDGGDFDTMPSAILSLFAITVGLYQGDFRDIESDQLLLYTIFGFLTLSVVLLMNLLIAQLNKSYDYIYQDMLGFAQLNRAQLIVDAMESVSKKRWKRFVASQKFDERMEFSEGDLGLPGGVEAWEPASLHMQMRESIIRFGGTTSGDSPWPEDKDADEQQERFSNHVQIGEQADESDERLDRIEKLVQKTVKRIMRAQDLEFKRQASPAGGMSLSHQVSGGGASQDSRPGDSQQTDGEQARPRRDQGADLARRLSGGSS